MLDGDLATPRPERDTAAPHFRPMSLVAKRSPISATEHTQHMSLVNVDGVGRPHTKLPLNARPVLGPKIKKIQCMSQVQTQNCLNRISGQRSNETLLDWSNYIREIIEDCLNDAQPIAGPGIPQYSWTKHT